MQFVHESEVYENLSLFSISDVVGVFRRNESVAIRGKVKAGGVQKLLDELALAGEGRGGGGEGGLRAQRRRGSEGLLVNKKRLSLEIISGPERRRNSSPNISCDDLAVIRRPKKNSDSAIDKRKRHSSSYIELLEEVTNELNLQAVKVASGRKTLIDKNAFDFPYIISKFMTSYDKILILFFRSR